MGRVDNQVYRNERKMLGSSSGDNIWFFILSNTISLFVFFILGYYFDLFTSMVYISDLISMDFLNLYVKIVCCNIMASLIGWMLGYFTLKILKIYVLHTRMKTFGDLSRGLNKFPLTSLAFYISTVISSCLFTIGALELLQRFLFGEISIIAMMITYLILKLSVYSLTKMIIESKF